MQEPNMISSHAAAEKDPMMFVDPYILEAFYIDITWSDEKGLSGSPEWSSYFMLTQDEILIDHEITDGKAATGTAVKLLNKPQQ
jgi:hypothetical protein